MCRLVVFTLALVRDVEKEKKERKKNKKKAKWGVIERLEQLMEELTCVRLSSTFIMATLEIPMRLVVGAVLSVALFSSIVAAQEFTPPAATVVPFDTKGVRISIPRECTNDFSFILLFWFVIALKSFSHASTGNFIIDLELGIPALCVVLLLTIIRLFYEWFSNTCDRKSFVSM